MREQLVPLDGQRAFFTATVADFGSRRHLRRVLLATLLANIEYKGQPVCDHIWIDGHLPPEFKKKRIRLSALVVPYRRKDFELDYGFRETRQVKIIGIGL